MKRAMIVIALLLFAPPIGALVILALKAIGCWLFLIDFDPENSWGDALIYSYGLLGGYFIWGLKA